MRQKFIFTFFLLFTYSIISTAQRYFESNGIRYRVIQEADGQTAYGTVSVAAAEFDDYSGDIVIPSAVKEIDDSYSDSYKVIAIDDYAFAETKELVSITLPSSLETIGEKAFWGSGLNRITIPMGKLTGIGTSVFSGCWYLQSVALPSTVKKIGDDAFSYCYELQTISMPGVVSIGKYAFKNCNALKEIVLPEPLKYIQYEAFASCDNLCKVTCGNNLLSIGELAFSQCPELVGIDLPESLREIQKGAFLQSGINHIKIPNRIKVIEEGLFSMSKLQTIILPENLEKIEPYAFAGLKMESLDIPEQVFVHPEAFYGTTFWDKKEKKEIISQIKNNQQINIVHVKSDKRYTFSSKGCLYEVELLCKPEEEFGFAYLKKINHEQIESNIVVPEVFEVNYQGVTSKYIITDIAPYAFKDCSNLHSIQLPITIKQFPIFAGCINLVEFKFNKTYPNRSIPDYMFQGCKSLRHFTIPQGTHKIGNNAFEGSGLEEIDIPEGVDSIGEEAFADCKLQRINLPSSLKIIKDRAFRDNTTLKTVHLPEGLEKIEKAAFCDSPIDTIIIPKSVIELGYNAFQNAHNAVILGRPKPCGWAFYRGNIQSILLSDCLCKEEFSSFQNVKCVEEIHKEQMLEQEKQEILASIDRDKKTFESEEDVLNYLRTHRFVDSNYAAFKQWFDFYFKKINYTIPSGGYYPLDEVTVVSFTKNSAIIHYKIENVAAPLVCEIQINNDSATMKEQFMGEGRTFIVEDIPYTKPNK